MISRNTTIIIFIFIVIAVVLASIGWYYFASQKKVEESPAVSENIISPPIQATTTPGTKLYRNEERGVEFEYMKLYGIEVNLPASVTPAWSCTTKDPYRIELWFKDDITLLQMQNVLGQYSKFLYKPLIYSGYHFYGKNLVEKNKSVYMYHFKPIYKHGEYEQVISKIRTGLEKGKKEGLIKYSSLDTSIFSDGQYRK